MELDSFDNGTPIELPTQEEQEKALEGPESFAHKEVIELKPSSQVEKIGEAKIGDEDKKDDEEVKLDEEKKPEEKKEDEEAKIEVKKEDEKPKGKTLKFKHNGETTDISEESTVAVKVNGKKEFVSVADLKANYSGKISHTEQFQKLETEKKESDAKIQTFTAEKTQLQGHMTEIGRLLDSEGGNPMDALNYLVDMSGRDTVDFQKKVFSYLSEELGVMNEMSDDQKELYWSRKEIDSVRNNQEANKKRQADTQSLEATNQKVNSLRESHGVSEEDYVKSHNDMISLGYTKEQLTPEVLVNYAVMTPHYEKAEGICSYLEEDLSSDDFNKVISTVAQVSKNFPNLSEEKKLTTAMDHLGWKYSEQEDDIAEANKLSKKDEDTSFVGKVNKGEEHLDSFDDYDTF